MAVGASHNHTVTGKQQGMRSRVPPNVPHAVAVTFSLLAIAAAVGVFAWAQWPLIGRGSLDQRDAVIVPSLLAGGLSATLAAIPSFLAQATPWLVLFTALVWFAAVLGYGGIGAPSLLAGLTPLEHLSLRFGLGILWIGLASALCGVMSAFRPLPLLLLLGVGILLLARELPAFVRGAQWTTLRPRFSWPGLIIGILGGVYFAVGLLYAMTPPIQSDGMRYHLAAIQEFLRSGGMHYIPFNAFSNFPFLVEMHFAFGLAVGLPEVAQFVHYSFFVFAGLQLTAVTRFLLALQGPLREEVRWGAWLPALLYWTLPANAIVAAWPFIDQATNYFWFAAVGACLLAQRTAARRHFLLLGLLLGAAVGTKYTSLAFAFLLMACCLVSALWSGASDRHPKGTQLKGLVLVCLAASLAGCFWYIKNLVFTGNPIYPLGVTLFGGGEFSSDNAALYASKMAEKGVAKTLTHFLLSPWHATFRWTLFEHHFVSAHALVVFVLAAGALIRMRAPQPVLQVFVLALLLHAMWFFTYQSHRMIAPALGLLASASVAALWSQSMHHLARRAFSLAVAIAALHGAAYTLQYETAIHRPPLVAYMRGTLSRQDYLAEALNYYRAFQRLGQRVKPGEKVLLIGEHRIFYAPFEAIWSDWFDTPAILGILRAERPQTVADLVKALLSRGIAWVLVNEAELAPQLDRYWKPRFRPEEWAMIQQFIGAYRPRGEMIRPGVLIFSLDEGGRVR